MIFDKEKLNSKQKICQFFMSHGDVSKVCSKSVELFGQNVHFFDCAPSQVWSY